ncbi:ATP-binding cassette domain-containing protein [Halalkalibacter sp. APA_J-10(15)]|uniref:ATP-binding cassette domain-containing protein n=1 Tax=unclassified Halalkalibacter TaxID=2893063 RepID=UPI001FF5A206|nr:ATP-binding cassette domain-containing protein [Halalkalibacter sp. APA_J-10(15)]MCK0471694.1 ATP-binding cassette domain-containing protein [Halalkalibacter sp. APA_J-10(15)]
MSHQAAIKVENLTKAFNGKEIIKSCNMFVKEKSIYGFLGANGAGKTTVFKIITGLLSPTTGKIEVCGMEGSKQREDILRNIGSMIETPVFYEHLSAESNLRIHLSYMGIQEDDKSKRIMIVGSICLGLGILALLSGIFQLITV